MASPLYLFHFYGLLATDDTSLTRYVGRLAMVKVVVPTIRAFLRTICYGAVSKYGSAKMRYEIDCMEATGPMGLLCWTLAPSVEIPRLMEEYHVDPPWSH